MYSGIWSWMEQIVLEGKESQARLMEIRAAVGQSKASSTRKDYSNCFRNFHLYCQKQSIPVEKATEAELAMFLQGMVSEGKSAVAVAQTALVISRHFQMVDRADPAKHKLISAIVAMAKRTAPPMQHKELATLAHLHHLWQYAKQKGTFATNCTFAISTMLFTTCSRLGVLMTA